MNKIRESIIEIFDENGINIYEDEESIELDSLMYISIIVAIEEKFQVEVPDEYLKMEKLQYLSDFVSLINMLQ